MGINIWQDLALVQAGMVSQRQLTEAGVSRAFVRSQLRARRWSQRTSSVFSTTTGPLSWDQRLWLAALHAGPNSVIGGLTAAHVHGLRGWNRDDITVLVGNDLSFEAVRGVRFFRTRRPIGLLRVKSALPLCALEHAVLLFAGYERNRRTAHGAIAAVVQQRLTTLRWLPGRPLQHSTRNGSERLDGVQDLAESVLRVAEEQ